MITDQEKTHEYILVDLFQMPRQVVDRARFTEADVIAGNAVYQSINSPYMWMKAKK